MEILLNGKKYVEYQYQKEEEFEKDIVKNSKSLFGEKTIYIDVKRGLNQNTGMVQFQMGICLTIQFKTVLNYILWKMS